MNTLKKVKTIFFDYDGTLHNSIKVYAPAFMQAHEHLVQEGLVNKKSWTEEEISHWLGFNSVDMWKAFMPNLNDEIKKEASLIIGREMTEQIKCGKAVLYDGALDTLDYLKDKGYKLVFISNCGIYYRDMARDTFKLDKYFYEMACSEEHDYIPKYEILEKIMINYPEEMVIIGDRFQDIEAGKRNNIYTIGCNYGYGTQEELSAADFIINDIQDLKELL